MITVYINTPTFDNEVTTLKVTLTANEAIDKGLWDEICEMKGWNPWIVNEGRMDGEEEITLTPEQARKLGILRKRNGED